MKGDIALAGFVLTHEEWQELDAEARTQLLVAAGEREPRWARGTNPGLVLPPLPSAPPDDDTL
jgi:hypothetical protein